MPPQTDLPRRDIANRLQAPVHLGLEFDLGKQIWKTTLVIDAHIHFLCNANGVSDG